MTTVNDTESDVDAFVAAMMADPAATIDRILEKLLGGGVEQVLASALGGPSGDVASVGSIGNERLAGGMGGRAEPVAVDPSLCHATADTEYLLDRNSLLAAALGACDCWGLDPSCPFCEGHGGTGWTRPDRALFVEFVYPAVRAMRTARTGHQRTRTNPSDDLRLDDTRRDRWT